jgi:hypothetical protein
MSRLQRKVIVVGLSRLCAAGAAVVVNVVLARGLEREVNGGAQQTLLLAGVAICSVNRACRRFATPSCRALLRSVGADISRIARRCWPARAAAAAGALLLAPWLAKYGAIHGFPPLRSPWPAMCFRLSRQAPRKPRS